jgi:hypothetical protein
MLLLRVEPAFDSLRSDPRFQDLVWRVAGRDPAYRGSADS